MITLPDFIKQYDRKDAVVLLEGKRTVAEADREKLIKLGRLLAQETKHILFRSGNAEGSDLYFSTGVCAIDRLRLQVITPYSGHRKAGNKAYETISLNDIDMANEQEAVYQSKQNKKTKNLIDRYMNGDRDRYAIKAAYILRDTIKVIGAENIPPAAFGIFYDDLLHPMQGGTGHTMNVCRLNKIDFINQETWFQWIT